MAVIKNLCIGFTNNVILSFMAFVDEEAFKKLEERGVVIRFVIGRRLSQTLKSSFCIFMALHFFFLLYETSLLHLVIMSIMVMVAFR